MTTGPGLCGGLAGGRYQASTFPEEVSSQICSRPGTFPASGAGAGINPRGNMICRCIRKTKPAYAAYTTRAHKTVFTIIAAVPSLFSGRV